MSVGERELVITTTRIGCLVTCTAALLGSVPASAVSCTSSGGPGQSGKTTTGVRVRVGRVLAAFLITLTAIAATNLRATSADAAAPCPSGSDGPYTGSGFGTTHTHYCTEYFYGPFTETVLVQWGFDYSPASNHLRAFAFVTPNADLGDPGAVVGLSPMNLGDRNGVLASITYPDAQTSNEAIGTPVVGCHKEAGAFYLANVHLTILWGNGVYTFPQTGQLGYAGSTICR